MPGKLKVKIIAGRNLPVMDRSSDTTDAFVEMKLGSTTYKTDVCRKTLNPQWNSEWYKFEMDDSELQDEPLQIRLMDYDTYSANDAIGKVYLNLNPLLLPSPMVLVSDTSAHFKGGTISGWLPVYDTMHGIRGEVNIIVKLDLFEDYNRFRQSSCGVRFFSSVAIPEGYQLRAVSGFVEELVFADDPEYQWIDKIRTPRSTNEARQTLFFKLNGEVKRKIGLKVLDLGANAVLGYKQCFDLEGECGIVVRGLGTAVTLEPHSSPRMDITHEVPTTESFRREPSPLCRRSSDSDISVIPRGNSLNISEKSSKQHLLSQRSGENNFDMGEYPFLTLTKYPPGFVQHIGGVVSARAVKLLGGVDEAETRDSWWTELRLEVRAHARALTCNAVIAYSEHTTICEEVCILSATGTAAVINHRDYSRPLLTQLTEEEGGCSVYHVPYSTGTLPFRMNLAKCAQCKKGKVGEVLMSTAELMDGVTLEGKGTLIQAVVCRHKRDVKGEINAKEVSDALPFLEYELHTQLVSRLNSIGANAIVGLRVELCLGERVLVGHATGTGITLSALPMPTTPLDTRPDIDGSDLEEGDGDDKELDLSCGNKETCLVEVGDGGGGIIGTPPDGFLVSTSQGVPGALSMGLVAVRNLQMFTQIWKARMCPLPSAVAISAQFHRLLQGVYFKLRGMTPCALANLRFRVDLPQQDELQISVVGMAIGLAETEREGRIGMESPEEKFNLPGSSSGGEIEPTLLPRNSRKSIHTPPREQRYGVDVTPLSYVAGGRILCYLGNLNFFFIRESTCIRETGGLNAFVHGFVAEVLAIVRAHVMAIGGNAFISYTMAECRLTNNAHKNQAQCLINVGGDAVYVSYADN